MESGTGTNKPLHISDLGWTREEAWRVRQEFGVFADGWDDPKMDIYNSIGDTMICNLCRKEIKPDEVALEIRKGYIRDGDFYENEGQSYGYVHKECIDSVCVLNAVHDGICAGGRRI